jgi:hypothetical protein
VGWDTHGQESLALLSVFPNNFQTTGDSLLASRREGPRDSQKVGFSLSETIQLLNNVLSDAVGQRDEEIALGTAGTVVRASGGDGRGHGGGRLSVSNDSVVNCSINRAIGALEKCFNFRGIKVADIDLTANHTFRSNCWRAKLGELDR